MKRELNELGETCLAICSTQFCRVSTRFSVYEIVVVFNSSIYHEHVYATFHGKYKRASWICILCAVKTLCGLSNIEAEDR